MRAVGPRHRAVDRWNGRAQVTGEACLNVDGRAKDGARKERSEGSRASPTRRVSMVCRLDVLVDGAGGGGKAATSPA